MGVACDRGMQALMEKYKRFGVLKYTPFDCVYERSDRWEFSGACMVQAGKQRGQSKGWHFGEFSIARVDPNDLH